MSSSFAAATVNTADALAALEPEWWALWRRVRAATPFQSPAWLLPWWLAFKPGELSVVTIRRNDRLVGLAPLYIEAGARGRRVLPLGISISDYLDILLEEELASGAGAALCRHLSRFAGDWDEWELTELAPNAVALRLRCPAGCKEQTERAAACMVLALPDRPEALESVLPRRMRRNIHMSRNRAGRRGPVVILGAERSNLVALLAELFRLHGERWAKRNEPGVLADARVVQFHEMAVRRLFNAGLLRFYALRIGPSVVGAYYGFLHRGRAYAYLMGFDPDYAFVSPGTILFAHAVEEAVREGAREMDLLRGEEPYKFGWGAEPRFNRRRIFRRSIHRAGAA